MRNPLPRNSNHHSDDLTHRTRAILSVLALAFVYGSPLQAATQEEVINEPDVPAAIIGEAPPLKGEAIAYFPGSPKTSGYLSLPEGNIKGGVILIHEWNGLSQRIRETADAFAAEGYAALAADLYQGRIGQSRSENLALVRETQSDPELIIDNLNAAVLALKGRSGAKRSRPSAGVSAAALRCHTPSAAKLTKGPLSSTDALSQTRILCARLRTKSTVPLLG